jgi:uncharacterized protein YdhG (YjbR/CyaY superfamily)
MPKVSTVDAYLETLDPPRRAVVQRLRQTVAAAAPDAVESIAYDMPAFRSHGGQFLVSFAAYRQHYSLFPASDGVVQGLGAEIAPYLSGKGTIRFPANAPIPYDTVGKVVSIRLAENAAKHAERPA